MLDVLGVFVRLVYNTDPRTNEKQQNMDPLFYIFVSDSSISGEVICSTFSDVPLTRARNFDKLAPHALVLSAPRLLLSLP